MISILKLGHKRDGTLRAVEGIDLTQRNAPKRVKNIIVTIIDKTGSEDA